MQLATTAELLFFNVARLLVNERESATGFFVGWSEDEKDERTDFLVTAKHVIENANSVIAFLPTMDETSRSVSMPYSCSLPDDWYLHPDPRVDLAVLPFGRVGQNLARNNTGVFTVGIDRSEFLPRWQDAPGLIFEHLRSPKSLDELFFVGFPNGYYDPISGLPILRRGITATPLWLPFNGEPGFLIDAAVIPGSSGSPVFHLDWKAADIARRTARLVGVICRKFIPRRGHELPVGDGSINLGFVQNAHCIEETIRSWQTRT